MDEYKKRVTEQWEYEIAKNPRILLWPRDELPGLISGAQHEPSVVPFLQPGEEPKGAVIVCAGGAYMWKEPLEAFPHAMWLNAIGVHAFVLDYRIEPYKPDCALQDAQRAIRTLRYRSDDWKIKKDSIGLIGFSAGGHLTAMASTHFDYGNPRSSDPMEQESCRPDAQVLCYPHITYDPYIQDDPEFMNKRFGEGYTQDDVNKVNAHLHVRSDTPPAFLWGMQGDWQCKQKQWRFYTEALEEKGIAYSYHVFPHGSHNEGRESTSPVWRQWTMLCEIWLRDLGF